MKFKVSGRAKKDADAKLVCMEFATQSLIKLLHHTASTFEASTNKKFVPCDYDDLPVVIVQKYYTIVSNLMHDKEFSDEVFYKYFHHYFPYGAAQIDGLERRVCERDCDVFEELLPLQKFKYKHMAEIMRTLINPEFIGDGYQMDHMLEKVDEDGNPVTGRAVMHGNPVLDTPETIQ